MYINPYSFELVKVSVTFLFHLFEAYVSKPLLKLANNNNVCHRLAEPCVSDAVNVPQPPLVNMGSASLRF